MPHRLKTLFLTLALAAGAATAANASSGMQVGISDEGVTQRNAATTGSTVANWRRDGVQVARVLAIWNYVAPLPQATHAPKNFRPSDPNDSHYNWGDLDRTIFVLRANGIEPLLAITGPGPVWASRVPSRRSGRYKPDPSKFAAFASAVTKRYGASVSQYIVWNEPNLPFWLQPQYSCSSSGCQPASPAIYRSLFRAAAPAIRAADPGAQVYAGALASRGQTPRSANANMRPLSFLRALGCVDGRLRTERRSPGCRGGFQPIDADGIAYHPHGTTAAPDEHAANADEAYIADVPRLLKTIDGIQRAHGARNGGSFTRRFNLFFSEYGYQTSPPDPVLGVSSARQASWIQQGAYLAWRQPRVKLLIQYLWQDDPVTRRNGRNDYSGWQSGLHTAKGTSKPAAKVFANPLWVDLPRGRREATVWGQVRPGSVPRDVTIDRRRSGSSAFAPIKRMRTDSRGFFSFHTIVSARARYRYRYVVPDDAGREHHVTTPSIDVVPR